MISRYCRLEAHLSRCAVADRHNRGGVDDFTLMENDGLGTDSQRTEQDTAQRPVFIMGIGYGDL